MATLFVLGIFLILPLILLPLGLSVRDFVQYHQRNKMANFIPTENDPLDHQIVDPAKGQYRPWIRPWEYAEVLFLGIAPVAGVYFISAFKNDIHPFALPYTPTLGVFIAIGYLSYWLSRKLKQELPLLINLMLPYGMAMGVLLYAILALHFISFMTLLGAAFLPIFAFPLFAPVPAILYNLRQINQQNLFINDLWQKQANEGNLTIEDQDALHVLQWKNPVQNIALLLTMMFAVQVLLMPFDQPVDALIQVLRESRDFLFSK